MWPPPFVSVYPQRTNFDIQMFHDESWKPIYLGVKKSLTSVTTQSVPAWFFALSWVLVSSSLKTVSCTLLIYSGYPSEHLFCVRCDIKNKTLTHSISSFTIVGSCGLRLSIFLMNHLFLSWLSGTCAHGILCCSLETLLPHANNFIHIITGCWHMMSMVDWQMVWIFAAYTECHKKLCRWLCETKRGCLLVTFQMPQWDMVVNFSVLLHYLVKYHADQWPAVLGHRVGIDRTRIMFYTF